MIDEKEKAEKLKALNNTINQIEKQFGKGAIMKMSDKPDISVDVIHTGSLKLDEALGIGGIPRGRIVEIFGPESGGKTTLALHIVAELQKQDGVAAFIDAEHALDPVYARNIGVNIDDLYVSQPSSGEEGMEICDKLVNSGAIDLIVVDSVAALVPKAELQGEMGDAHVGLQARLMSQGLRKLTASTSRSNCTIIFINQLREKVGVMFGNPEVTPGGRALKFYSSIRIDVRRIETLKDSTSNPYANKVKVKTVKNKVAPPFKTTELRIVFGKGIDVISEILDIAIEYDIIKKAGSWFTLPNEERVQGYENIKNMIENNEELKNEIKILIDSKLKKPLD